MKTVLVALSVLVPTLVAAGPLGGPMRQKHALSTGSADSPSTLDLPDKVTFLAGERACVMVTRPNRDIGNVKFRLVVLDQKRDVVASDSGSDCLAAIWHPKNDVTCTIRIENFDSHEHTVFVAIK